MALNVILMNRQQPAISLATIGLRFIVLV